MGRNLSYVPTQRFLRRHVISGTSGEITRILYEIIIALCSSCQEETLLINNEYMTIGQAKAKPYWFALCLTDVFYLYFVLFGQLFLLSLSSQRLAEWEGEEKTKQRSYYHHDAGRDFYFSQCHDRTGDATG